ncbi:ABC transporter ATP-binding protein [Fervidibacillus halotolerans]|uniref:Carnitine transport ATP-binding protein OpuCA n=1 Tax=Fervidibacillus halotolerans TaxID=2980027 RepID=A0A9E8M0J1_9BACI|nr:ABC transporter ATP-binding protein [Fervidibacillus halotolerans]WAA12772.1 ABC transporter ATP-binding protein [Fervidibacillus halotolerans]
MIQLNGISKSYGNVSALRGIDLFIKEGEFIAILGPSGCGKTTLLKLLAGFMKPTKGTMTMNGTIVASVDNVLPPEKRNIGMVFQSFALWPHMTVYEHVQFPLIHHSFAPKVDKKWRDERVKQVLRMVGLESFAQRYPHELSGGQKQRVSLARAIAPEPNLLLMDEPLSALDAELRMELRKEIQQIHKQTNASIVYVTHDQSEAFAMADRIVVMNRGNIEQIDRPEIIFSRPKTEFVATFVGKCNFVKGLWKDGRFIPNQFPNERWPDSGVSSHFKKRGLYPVRPDQWSLKKAKDGSGQGIIKFVQYQGKEIHYIVQVGEKEWTVHEQIQSSTYLQEGDSVHFVFKNKVRNQEAIVI